MSKRLRIERAVSYEWRNVDDDGTVEGSCPGCGCDPFRVVVVTKPEDAGSHEDRVGTRCSRCKDPVGWMYIERASIFGREEDRTFLMGRPRVYD